MADLRRKRGQVKAKLSRFASFLDSLGPDVNDSTQVQLRIEKIQPLLDEFEIVQSEIEFMDDADQLVEEEERKSFENSYFSALEKAKNICKAVEERTKPAVHNEKPPKTVPKVIDPSNTGVKLPQMQLPKFGGKYEEWLPFHDLFTTLIHENDSLTELHKFYYLKSCLHSEAANVINSLELTTTNYSVAWSLLKDRYHNTTFIIQKHVKALFNIKKVERESAEELHKLLDEAFKHIRALEALKQPIDKWDTLLIHLITSKLDSLTFRQWQSECSADKLPVLKDLRDFLEHRCQILESVAARSSNPTNIAKVSSHQNFKNSRQSGSFVAVGSVSITCSLCSGSHHIYSCEKFIQLPVKERIEQVKLLKLCSNCLRTGHFESKCKSRSCKFCNKRHNSLLHIIPQPTAPVEPSPQSAVESTPVLNSYFATQADQVLLSTAVIYILDRDGLPFPCRALLDSGSHANFISERLSKMLRLESCLTNQPIKGIGGVSTSVSQTAQTVIRSKFSDFSSHLKFFVLPKISERIPIAPINKSVFQIPKSIFLADHEFNVPSRVDALLGASIFWEILGEKRILLHNNVHLIETKLGWILGGKLNPNPDAMSIVPTHTCHLATTDMQLNDTLKQFWHIEEVSGTPSYTGEDAECEEHFQLNTTRAADGKYVVALPFKSDRSIIGDTEQMALRRYQYLENRLKNDHNLKTEYTKFMKEYIELNHMVEVTAKELANTKHKFFLPHHPVIKPSSSTTKVRVVFDASAKSATGISLNDTCMTGPVVQSDLFSILLRLRTHRYVFTTDIEKMYRQIWIKPEHAMLQLIFWRESDSLPLKIYKLLTVTYGTKPAAYLATRTLLQLSRDEKDFPRASEILARDFYVDDGMTGSETVEDAKALRDELRQLLHKGGFHLRKWSSNHPGLLEDLPREDIAQEHLSMGKDSKIKTLGIVWDPNKDTFNYSINLKPLTPHNISKRAILGTIAQIFDPLGLIGPVIVTAKLIMQQLWQDGIDWDDAVPHSIAQSWRRFHNSLDALNNFRIPRYIFSVSSAIVRREIHGFCDASERAYGACAYLRSIYSDNSIHVSLICAKSRVAPIKTASLPRLELCGALLLVQLLDKIKSSIHFSLDQFYYYTDSTIVLAWLSAPSTHWTTFVANRVAKIQDSSHVKDWRHVKGSDNPADIISRGAYPDDLLNLHEWWNGPEWLHSDSSHPVALASDLNHTDEIPEAKQSLLTFVATNISTFDFSRFSSYNKLLATVAYCKRFIKIIKCRIQHDPNVPKGPLSVSELNDSLQTLLLIAQQQSFQRERELLGQGKNLQKDSKLINLHPFLDSVGLIRVGGRLTNSNLNSGSKHPIVLCSKHKFTQLLITNEHKRLLHAGQQSLLASIRQRYWPLNARNLIKKIIHNCIRCFRTNPGNMTQLMGDLPRSRLQVTRPFYRTGVDYLGPVFVKPPHRKGNTQIKTYVALFICLSTKAVHLEIAEDLSANAFIDVLRRFVSRRGKPIEILSDNATNFTKANKDLDELKILFERCYYDILNELSYQGIQFRFNPPRAPHFGGLWESNIKIAKNHIKRVMGNSILTLMEFNTLLCQIEACLNSRPLHPLSQDPSDFTILTPSHFLIGNALTAIPEPDLDQLSLSRLDHWQRIQKLHQQFWKSWSRDYLQELQTRHKWKHPQTNLKIGTLVLVKEDNLPPLNWKLARVEQLHPGHDGRVRVATLRTPHGLQKRPIVRLCPLPMDQEDDTLPTTSVVEASK